MQKKIIRLIVVCIILFLPWLIGQCNSDIENEDSICISVRYFHIPCLGCGLTKSIIYFYKGDFIKSFYYHYWGGPLVLLSFVLIVMLVYDIVRNQDYSDRLLDNYMLWQVVGICVLITYFIRIVQFYS